MDLMVVDTDTPPQSKSDADLALYLATSNASSSRASPLPWHAVADGGYDFGHSSLGLYDASNDLGYGWSEEEANQYIVANHPLVEHEGELSDRSYTTDSGSRGSSNQHSDPSFAGHAESGYHDLAWHNFPAYGSHVQGMLLPPVRLGSPAPGHLRLPENHLPMYLPVSTSGSRFLESSGPIVLPHPHRSPEDTELLLPPLRDLLVDHPSPLSSTSSPNPLSPSEGQYISPEEINAPYLPRKDDAADTDLRATSSPDDNPNKSSMRLTRSENGRGTRGGRSRAPNGRRSGLGASRRNPDTKDVPMSTGSGSKRRRPSYSSSSDTSIASQVSIPLLKRPRRRTTSKVPAAFIDSDSGDDSGDAYLPSQTPSPNASPGPSDNDARSPSLSPEYSQPKPKKRIAVKGKGKATDASRMTAAEALKQLAAEKANTENGGGDGGEYQAYHTFEAGKRKNGTIPLPVPVPHLIKKSRGRKVPYVDVRVARPRPSASEDEPDAGAGGSSRGTPSRRGRGGRRGTGGPRSFVCDVPGCGKCFVRGEHLKRHVRSIHTHDKPHQCPYDGCDKSFSRRDNLGQHVRLHLMDSL